MEHGSGVSISGASNLDDVSIDTGKYALTSGCHGEYEGTKWNELQSGHVRVVWQPTCKGNLLLRGWQEEKTQD